MKAVCEFVSIVSVWMLAGIFAVGSWLVVWPEPRWNGELVVCDIEYAAHGAPETSSSCARSTYRPTPPPDGMWCGIPLDAARGDDIIAAAERAELVAHRAIRAAGE